LRIAVGFKVTPDYEALRPADWARLAAAEDPEGRAEAARYIRRAFGVFDEAALELALRLRDARAERGLETSLAAFSVAGREAGVFIATLQALGFECARVDPGPAGAAGVLDFAPQATAALVAACTERLGGDVLLLGARCGPAETGTVPFLSAEALGRPCVTEVTAVEPAGDRRLRVTFVTDDGPLRAVVTPPCVLAVGNAVVSMLRVPTLRDRMATREAPVAELTPARLGVDLAGELAGEAMRLIGLETIDRGRAGVVMPGETPADKAGALYEHHLRALLEEP
jgi:electron transfer flavoprotein alpha/beta subunit